MNAAARNPRSADVTARLKVPSPAELEAAAERLDLARLKPGVDAASIDPDHHLWMNGGRWWCSFSLVVDGWLQRRVRTSLSTGDIEVARRRRDGLLALLAESEGCEIALRFKSAAARKPRLGRAHRGGPR